MDLRQVLPAGQVLDGKYRIERVIGAGGFGITYAAHDIGLNTTVALKEYYPAEFGMRDGTMSVRPRSNADRDLFERLRASFVEEARTLVKFRHPSIVRVLSVFESHGTAYMAMDFEDGRSLKAWMKELGHKPTQDEVDRIFYPVLDAMETLHEAHFLHRDIAPDNIIIRPNGSPVLLDFGAARRVAVAERSSQMTGLIKLGYSPQEQYTSDGKAQGAWTDIYALGATLFHVVTGAPPPESTVRFIEDTMRPASSHSDGEWRPEFLAGIDSALAVRPGDRPQSIAELRPLLFGDYEPPVLTRRPSRPLERISRPPTPATRVPSAEIAHPEFQFASSAGGAAVAAAQPASPTFRAGVFATVLLVGIVAIYQINMRRQVSDVPSDTPVSVPDSRTKRPSESEPAATPADTARQADDAFREGVRLATGNGVAVDHVRARSQFEIAAASGRADAMAWLGRIYFGGLGVAQDLLTARDWFERAASSGDVPSMAQLGQMYLTGQGVTQDLLTAREWLERAAASGNVESTYTLGLLYYKGQGVTQDFARARELFERAAQNSHVQSILNLAQMNKSGQGGPVDLNKHREWLEKAAATGHPSAMNQLGVIYTYNDRGVSQDYAKARNWFEQSITSGNAVAMHNLARLLSQGQGGAVDASRAATLLLSATLGNYDTATTELAGSMARWSKETRIELKRQLQQAGSYTGALTETWDDAAKRAVVAYRNRAR